MDETHRRFYSGRFGAEQPAAIEPDFQTQIEKTKGVTSDKKKSLNADQESYQEDVKAGRSVPGMEGE